MDQINTALAVVNLINQTMPIGVGLILRFVGPDGTETVLNTLDRAEAGARANIDEMQAHINKIKAGQ